MIDKKTLKLNFENQNYSNCITVLFNEIKNILIEKIKEKDSTYKYVTIGDLKNKAIKYLSTQLQSYAIALYTLVMQPEDELFELEVLLNMYEELVAENVLA